MSKYGAKKVIVTADGTIFDVETVKRFNLTIDGVRCDSVAEGEYLRELLQLKKEGAITEIECQPKFPLADGIIYIADFKVTFSGGSTVVIDVKGVQTPVFRLKAKMFRTAYPDLELRVIQKYHGRWMTVEEIKKEKSAQKRALNKLIKKAEEKGRNK